jgi:hypothetical protein
MLAQCNNTIKIISPISPKPTNVVVSHTCSTFTVKWQGQTNQKFVVTLVKKNSAGKILDTATTTSYTFDGTYYSTTMNVQQNRIVDWTVQAITTIKGIRYYSYGLRGEDTIPKCTGIPIADNSNKGNALSVTGEDKTLVKIYPNPVQSVLNIEFSGKNILKASINIYDVEGRLLINQSAQGNTQVNVRQLTPGTYLIKINDEKGGLLYSGKVVKQ